MDITGTYPFGAKLSPLVQADRSPKKIFVLGVYASAAHATWVGPDGGVLVRALAVASEPVIFWDGSGADKIIGALSVPKVAGHLEPADAKFNGPSGRSMDSDFLLPLGVTRKDAWLCDLVPHTCLNPSQLAAIKRAYNPKRIEWKLPVVDLPDVPKTCADDSRRAEVLSEIEQAKPDVLALLGDQPIRHFLTHYDRRWKKLADFEGYGRLHPVTLGSTRPFGPAHVSAARSRACTGAGARGRSDVTPNHGPSITQLLTNKLHHRISPTLQSTLATTPSPVAATRHTAVRPSLLEHERGQARQTLQASGSRASCADARGCSRRATSQSRRERERAWGSALAKGTRRGSDR